MKNFAFVILFLPVLFVSLAKTGPAPPLPNIHKLHRRAVGTQVVGGKPAKQGEAPYQLLLYYGDQHYCGASLVEVDGRQVGLTAATCVQFFDLNNFDLVAGDLNIRDETGFEQKRHVESVIVHPEYNKKLLQNDIAILVLEEPFNVQDNSVKTVPLPTQGQETNPDNLIISGWGDLGFGGDSSNDLHIATIPLIEDAICQEAYKDYVVQVTEDMICAGSPDGDISPCHVDSGGPAVSESEEGYLAGIISWGYECGHPEYPAVFTEVSHYIDWIYTAVDWHYYGTTTTEEP